MHRKIDEITIKVVDRLKDVEGIKAIVLGGSRATDSATIDSDIDIGIYYDSNIGLDAKRIGDIFAELDDKKRQGLITNTGDWGKWIDGGGWVTIDGMPVDILFRDFYKVTSVVNDCLIGNITIDYQSGHPFGFVNSIYMGEVYYCKTLFANDNDLQELKSVLSQFPQKYKKAVLDKFIWEAEFSLLCGRKSIAKNEIVYVVGSIYRTVNCIIQILYATNEMYLLNEKASLSRLTENLMPDGFFADIEKLFEGLNKVDLEHSFKVAEYCLERVKIYAKL